MSYVISHGKKVYEPESVVTSSASKNIFIWWIYSSISDIGSEMYVTIVYLHLQQATLKMSGLS